MSIAVNIPRSANKTAVQTTDGTSTVTIHSFAPGSAARVLDNCSLEVEGTLIGQVHSDGTQAVSMKYSAVFTVVTGVVALVGSQVQVIAPHGTSGLLTSVLTLDAASNAVRIRAKGVPSTTIDWVGWLDIKATPI